MLNDYTEIPIYLNAVGHLEVNVEIDGVTTLFLLDTGAGNTVIDIRFARENIGEFAGVDMQAGGVGTSTLELFHRQITSFKINSIELKDFDLYAVDLTHVKDTLFKKGITEPANGVLGADVFIKHAAVIDYDKKRLYLK